MYIDTQIHVTHAYLYVYIYVYRNIITHVIYVERNAYAIYKFSGTETVEQDFVVSPSPSPFYKRGD